MGLPCQFIGAADSVFESPPGPYLTRIRFVPPTKMKPGDMIIVLLASDADRESVSLAGGKLVIESRLPGSGGTGTTVQMLTTAGAELLELDGAASVRTRVKIGVSTWESQEALFNSSWFVRVKSRTGTGLIDGADMPQQQTTAFASSGLPVSWVSSVAWQYDENFAANVAGVRMFRRIVTDAEPSSYTFDSTIAKTCGGALLVYRGLASAAMIAGSASDFAATGTPKTPSRAMAQVSDLYIGGVWSMINWGSDPTSSVATAALPAGDDATERSDQVIVVSGVNARRLQVFDCAPKLIGSAAKMLSLGASQTGAAFAIALAGESIKGRDRGWSPVVAGAIGLPTEGI